MSTGEWIVLIGCGGIVLLLFVIPWVADKVTDKLLGR